MPGETIKDGKPKPLPVKVLFDAIDGANTNSYSMKNTGKMGGYENDTQSAYILFEMKCS